MALRKERSLLLMGQVRGSPRQGRRMGRKIHHEERFEREFGEVG